MNAGGSLHVKDDTSKAARHAAYGAREDARPPNSTRKSLKGALDEEGVEYPMDKKRAAAFLGISGDTLDKWTARYGIPHVKYDMAGNRGNRGKVLYLLSDLTEFRARYRVQGRDVAGEVDALLAPPEGRA